MHYDLIPAGLKFQANKKFINLINENQLLPPYTRNAFDSWPEEVKKEFCNSMLNTICQNQGIVFNISNDLATILTAHLVAKYNSPNGLETKHILVAGQLIRLIETGKTLHLASADLYRISASKFKLADLGKIKHKFNVSAYNVALANLKHIVFKYMVLTKLSDHSNLQTTGAPIHILYSQIFNLNINYENMLAEFRNVAGSADFPPSPELAEYILSNPFNQSLSQSAISDLSFTLLYMQLTLSNEPSIHERLNNKITSMLSSMPKTICQNLIHAIRTLPQTTNPQPLLPYILRILQAKLKTDYKVKLILAVLQNCLPSFCKQFESNLDYEVIFSGLNSEALLQIYDCSEKLKNDRHVYKKILQFIKTNRNKFNEFTATYRRADNIAIANKHIEHLSNHQSGLKVLCKIWGMQNSLGLNSEFRKLLACGLVTPELTTQMVKQILILARHAYDYDHNLNGQSVISNIATADSIAEGIEQISNFCNKPTSILRLKIQAIVKHNDGFNWCENIDGALHRLNFDQWIFCCNKDTKGICYSAENKTAMVDKILAITKQIAEEFANKWSLSNYSIARVSFTILDTQNLKPLVYQYRRAITPISLPSEQTVQSFRPIPLHKSESSPQLRGNDPELVLRLNRY